MMGYIWFAIILVAMVVAAIQGTMGDVTASSLDMAKTAVSLAIKLIGVMALFLGAMKVAQDAGLLKVIARAIRPVMIRLFPDVPPDHPAMGAMIMNMSANMLGLANAATPFGIKAMLELNKLNKQKGTATNAMVLFLAINTSNVTILPTGVIGIRHAAGSMDAAGIISSTLVATICSTIVAIIITKLLQRLPIFRVRAEEAAAGDGAEDEPEADAALAETEAEALEMDERAERFWRIASPFVIVAGLVGVVLLVVYAEQAKDWVIPMLLTVLIGYGLVVQLADKWAGREPRLEVYSSFVEGATEGWGVAKRIIPFLVAILVAVGMFRASGALNLLERLIGPVTEPLGLPAQALPMALMRPLSGSGAFGYMVETVNSAGPDSYVGYLVSTMQGSTETTFYVVAVYFGAVGVSKLRHTVPSALTADFTGVVAAVVVCMFLFGHTREVAAPVPTAAVVFAPDQDHLSRRIRQGVDDDLVPLIQGHGADACFELSTGADREEAGSALAHKRAAAALDYLVKEWEIPPGRFEIVAREAVACEGADDVDACRASNRSVRVTLVDCP
jgi:spore maturation protein SpmA/spore maturation protein SpmB